MFDTLSPWFLGNGAGDVAGWTRIAKNKRPLAHRNVFGYPPRVTPTLIRPEVIITHESDLDGLLSGLLLRRLARRVLNCAAPLQAFHNHNWKQRPLTEKAAWVADMTFEARLDRPGWMVLDHHATEVQAKQARLIHDAGKSAGLLCYELCREHGLASAALDRLVHLNNVADLFLESDPDFELAHDYANLVKSYGFWNLAELLEYEPERLLDHSLLEVMAVKRRVEDPLGFDWSRRNVVEIAPSIGYVNTVVGNTNRVVHRLLEEQATPYTVLLTLFRKGNGAVLVSLRSRNGGALRVAQQLQGGGHPNASGATLPRSVQNIPDAILYLRQLLTPAPAKPALNSLEAMLTGFTPA